MPLPLAVPIGMAAAGIFSQVYGGIKSGQQMKRGEELVQGQIDDLTAWYDTEKNKDFLSTNVASSAMNKVLENIEERNKISESSAAVTGASGAARIAAKSENQKQLGNVVKSLASYGTARQDQVEGRYRANLSQLIGQQANIAFGKAQNTSNLIDAGGKLLGASGELFGMTKFAA